MYGRQNWQILFNYENEQVLYKSVRIDLDQHFFCCMTQVSIVPNVCRRHRRIHCTALESIMYKYRKNNNNIKTCKTVNCSVTLAWYCFSSYSFASVVFAACNDDGIVFVAFTCTLFYLLLCLCFFIVDVIEAGAVVVVVVIFCCLLLVFDDCHTR